MHNYCPPKELSWAVRWSKVQAVLKSLDADILCLQEVEQVCVAVVPSLEEDGCGWPTEAAIQVKLKQNYAGGSCCGLKCSMLQFTACNSLSACLFPGSISGCHATFLQPTAWDGRVVPQQGIWAS